MKIILTDVVSSDRIRGYKRIDGRQKTFFIFNDSSRPAKARFLVWLVVFVFLCEMEVGAAFENIGLTARAMGMGGAYSAVVCDTGALIWNPAGASQMSSPEIGLSYVELYGLLGYSFVGWAHPLRPGQTVGAAVLSSSDTEGISLERVVLLSAATRVPGVPLHVGINVKSFSSSVNLASGVPLGDGAGWGLDFGLQSALNIRVGLIKIGLVLPNVLSQVVYEREAAERYSESLLREWRVGVAMLGDAGLVAVEMANGHPLIGGEYRFNSGDNRFAVRLGWRFTEGVSRGVTVGFGYHGGNLALDYAFVSGSYAAQSSRFSVRIFY